MDKEQYELLFNIEERHWWYLGMRRIVDSLLERHLPAARPLRILDAGCGTGGMTKHLERFGRTIGVDVASEAIDLGRQRGLSRLARASVERLPFVEGSFDLVVSFDVIYHRAVVDDRLALAEFHRVLAPGGLLLIRVPAYDWLRGAHDVAVHTRHRYSRGELSEKLEGTGFHLRKLTYVNSLLFPVAALKRMAEGTRRAVRPDLELPSPLLNRAFLGVLSLESAVLRTVSFPWGLSLTAVATKEVGN